MSKAIVFYFHVHQPFRVRPYTVFDTAQQHSYFTAQDQAVNQQIFLKVAEKSYRPMNALFQKLLETHPEFRFSLSITGTFLEQAEKWAPDVIASFQALIATGRVEVVAETYHHSLAFFYSRTEFEQQVQMHHAKIYELFGVSPTVFRNTELAYNNQLAEWAENAGYRGILAEGWDPILGNRTPNHVYTPVGTDKIKLLLKNYRLSDDMAFRFSNKAWPEWPLTAEKYAHWLNSSADTGQIINLFMDYETFGEHQWSDTGIFDFFEKLPAEWLATTGNTFHTVSEAIVTHPSAGEIDVPTTTTWADTERDLTAWLGNAMQQEAMRHLYALQDDILLTEDEQLITDWRNLQTSDHPYYMCTKWFTDGDVHAYFSPYESPYDAFMYYMNVIRDVRWRVMEHKKGGWHV